MTIFRHYLFNIFSISLLLFICGICFAAEYDKDKAFSNAVQRFNRGSYTDAEKLFANIPGAQSRIAQALSAFKQNKLVKAKALFLRAVAAADTDQQRFISLFNAASSAFLLGRYNEAVIFYNDALHYQTNDEMTIKLLSLSMQLNKLVLNETDKQNIKKSKKAGAGKLKIKLSETMLDREANISMEDISDQKQPEEVVMLTAENHSEIVNLLIKKGINAIDLDTNSTLSIVQSTGIDTGNNHYRDTQSNEFTPLSISSELWKRLFELEYGFPAELDSKESIPGHRKW